MQFEYEESKRPGLTFDEGHPLAVEPLSVNEATATNANLDAVKTSQRIRYDAEVEVIKKQHGQLEDMREKLQLSRRQICRALLVDPSAWTRWTRLDLDGRPISEAPAHVYKMLALFLEQKGQGRGIFTDTTVAKSRPEITRADLYRLKSELEKEDQVRLENFQFELTQQLRAEAHSQFETMKTTLVKGSELALGWKLLLILNVVLVLYVLFK